MALGLVPWLVALAACAHPMATPPPPQPPALSAPGVPHAAVATPWAGEPWRVDDTRVVWGGVRFEQRDETLEAAGGFAAPLIAAASTDAGWLFLTSDGLLARADEFLGTPEVIERWSEPGWAVRSTGRIVLANRDGLWTSVGQRLERMALDVPVYAAAFRGDWGLVVGDDVVHETRDGGRSWSTLDLAGELALDVVLHPDGGFVVMRTDGPHRRRGGTWESASSFPDAWDGVESSVRSPLLRAAATLPYMRLDAAFLEALEYAGYAVDEGCIELAFGGPFAFAYCSRADAEWWERRDGTRELRLDVADSQPPVVSLDGRTALWWSPCGGLDPATDEACALLDEQLVRVRNDHDASVRGVGGGLALLERHQGDELWERLVLVDLRTGRESPLRFSNEARTLIRGNTVQFEHVAIHSDGAVVALTFARAAEGNQRLVLVAGDPAVGLQVRRLPSGAAHATILRDGSAVAFGTEASDLFWAPDGGRFQRVPLRADGVVPYDPYDLLSCGATTCRVGVITIGTGPVPEPATAAGFGAGANLVRDTRTSFAAAVMPRDELRRFRLDCDGTAITARDERSGAVRSAAPEVRVSRRVEGGRVPPGRGRSVIEGGVERWSWRVSDGPEQHAVGPASSAPVYGQPIVARATRHYALVMRCAARGCDAEVMREGRIERVPAPPWSDYAAVPLDGGGTLVVARVVVSGTGARLYLGWHFDASGRLAHRIARTTPLQLARWGGYGWAERVGGELVFTSSDGTQRRASLPAHEGSDTCGNPRRDDALLVRSEDVVRVISGEELAAFPWVELTPQRACIRSYELRPLQPLDEWPSRIEAHHGRLRLVQRGRPIECRAP